MTPGGGRGAQGWRGWLKRIISELDLACFGAVMATGIVSTGTATEGFSAVATVLLAVCVGTFFLLLIATVWRLVRFTSRVWADTRNPQKTFGHFTLVAALNVIGLAIAPTTRESRSC